MIADDAMKQAVYQYLLKVTYRRLEQTIPGSSEGAFAHLSLAAVLNLLFLLRGEWGSLGDYVTTQRALRALVGDDLLWAEPQKAAPPPLRWLTSFVQRDSICTRTTGCRDTIRQEKPVLAGKAVWSHLEEGMIDDLITTLEIVRDAVWSKDKDKGFEAVTIFLLQFMDVFGHSHSFTSKMFPILEELKDRIQAGDFDEANSSVLALLVRMRQVKEALSASKE